MHTHTQIHIYTYTHVHICIYITSYLKLNRHTARIQYIHLILVVCVTDRKHFRHAVVGRFRNSRQKFYEGLCSGVVWLYINL